MLLDALLQGLPDELVDLEGEAGVDAVCHHPLDEQCEGSSVALSVVRNGLGILVEGGAEEDAAGEGIEAMLGDEGAGEVVVRAIW